MLSLFNRKTLFAPIALLAIVGAMTVFLVYNHFATGVQSKAWMLHSHDVIEAAQDVFSAAQDIESGTRGYLINGNPVYLDSYNRGLARMPAASARLEALVRDSDAQLERAQLMNRLLRARAEVATMRVELAASGRLDDARTVRVGSGRIAMERARSTMNELIAVEKKLLAERTKRSNSDDQIGIVIALGVSSLSILVLGFLIVTLFKSNDRMIAQIGAREASEAARRDSDLLYRAVFDHASESLFVIDVGEDGRFTLVDGNPAFQAGAEVSIATLRGLDIRKIRRGEVGERLVKEYQTVIEKGEPTLVRSEFVVNNEARIWEATLVPVRGEDGRISRIVGAGRDVTERERAEAQERSAHKMEAIGHLTGGVAHDFNNLLQVIRGNLELLEPHVRGSGQAAQRLRNAMHGADRAAQLTRQLLAFARRQPLEPKVINLGRLVQDMAQLLPHTLGEGVEVRIEVADGLWNTLADPAQVESAVLNLAVNARDAMDSRGRLTIALSNADLGASANSPEIEPGEYVLLSITDTGHGMTAETAARVFEPFFTTKSVDKGTGLGLSMVYGFVKQSRGHIQVDSELGKGAVIRIYLPRSTGAEERQQPARLVESSENSGVILVVEDEEFVRTAAVGMLNDLGYECHEAADAAQALRMLEDGLVIDLLFTDVVMPGPLKSRDLAERAQEMHPGLPVLFTSGYSADAIVHDGRLDEGVQLLSKPYQKDDLARRVRSVLDAARQVVLIVEDEPLVRMAAVDLIGDLGFAVLEAGDGPEALEILQSGARVDILFCDIGLPTMRGTEVASRALEIRPGLRVVFASGYGEAPGGEGEFLSKPYDQESLVRALRG